MFESIGQQLKREREARFLTLEKASEATRIRTVFLKALESDDYSVMPSAAQGRGFLRNYAEYLELNIDQMIAEIQKNSPQVEEVSGPLPQVNFAETEIPPLVAVGDERTERLSWIGQLRSGLDAWLSRQPTTAQQPPDQNENDTVESQAAEPEPMEMGGAEPEIPPWAAGDDEQTKGLSWVGQFRSVWDSWLNRQPTTVQPPDHNENYPVESQAAEPGSMEMGVVESEIPPLAAGNEEQTEGLSWVGQLRSVWDSWLNRQPTTIQPSDQNDTAERDATEPVEMRVDEPEIPRFIPSQTAAMIFAEIGVQLRERRELISLTFDEVERHTKLRVAFIKALEAGAFDKLPSPVQTRGMLANYATFLDLHTDAILLRFADGLQARRHEKYAETPREKIQTEVIASIPRLRSFIAGDLVFGVVMIALLLALAVWGIGRVISSQSGDAQLVESTAPSIVDVLGGTPLATPTLDVTFVPVDENVAVTSGAETAAPPVSNANVVLSIFALERVFVRISVDGKPAFEGRFVPGETKVFEANDQVMVLTGNAAALRIIHNGRDLGLMGRVGEVVSRVYLIAGAVTPTATITPTPTNTLPVPATPMPTGTPTFTPTIKPPDGG